MGGPGSGRKKGGAKRVTKGSAARENAAFAKHYKGTQITAKDRKQTAGKVHYLKKTKQSNQPYNYKKF